MLYKRQNTGRIEPIVMPCNLPCPKCGGADIFRKFYASGECIETDKYGKCPSRFSSGQGYAWTAYDDHIKHHCRCCQYDWETKPLPKKRKA